MGDEAFQRKSRERMLGFGHQGATVILVTHNSQMMQAMCERALWLEQGQVKMIGPADEVAAAYHASLF